MEWLEMRCLGVGGKGEWKDKAEMEAGATVWITSETMGRNSLGQEQELEWRKANFYKQNQENQEPGESYVFYQL